MTIKKPAFIQFMCTVCGAKAVRSLIGGRPDPGRCPRGWRKDAPHRWVINKKF